ncbi:CvpA family protein, partial [Ruminococcus flavefaciens]|uniref:CvpA family protein n=1 Tax=Ruminococcus flavefaciens TaxID=1265 RepID=UPI000565EC39
MGEQFWWFYDVVAVAAILVCIFITVKKGLLKAAFSLVGYVLAIAIAISLSSSIGGSIYEKSVKESNIKKMDQALTEREFNGELAKYLESLGYNIYVDRDRLETICEKGEKVDENLYNYVNNINGKKVDEEAIFYNKLHEGYATVMSGIISRHLSEYSAEYAAVQIEGDPLKFCEFMKLLEDKESMRAPAEFIVENYLGKPYRSQVRLITLLTLL